MANANATESNGICYITMPSNPCSMVLIPKTRGADQRINYCSLSDDSNPNAPQALGEWSVQMGEIIIVSNPSNLINTTTKHGIITENTDPTITRMTQISLMFTHQHDESAPIVADDLTVTVVPITDDITEISILAEVSGDQDYLDFQMTVVIADN